MYIVERESTDPNKIAAFLEIKRIEVDKLCRQYIKLISEGSVNSVVAGKQIIEDAKLDAENIKRTLKKFVTKQ